jgi:hypothetical protein
MLALGAPEPTVTLSGETWSRLNPAPPPPEAPPGARVRGRDLRVRWDGEVLRIRAEWTIDVDREEWLTLPLFGPGVHVVDARLGGERVPVLAGDGTRITARFVRSTTLVAEAVLPSDPTRGPVPLVVGPAASGTIRVEAPPGLVGLVDGPGAIRLGDRVVSGASALSIRVGPPAVPARDRSRLALASAGIGLTVGEAAVAGRARLSWTLRQGTLDRVSVQVRNVGADLQVEGAQVRSWTRSGDRVDVVLREPTGARVDLTLRWSSPLPDGDVASLPLPVIVPGEAFRTDASLQVARDAEIEVVPELSGWEAISAYDLPENGVGLVGGTPTAAYRAGAAGRAGTLALLRFVPADQPPVVIDVAATTVALSAEGRSLARVLLTTRNDRAPYLRLRPPPGHVILAARVDGNAVNLVDDGIGLRIPLLRSLETLEGLVSFPVELVLLGEGPPLADREARDLPLLAVDAPIAVSRTTVHLPPGYRNELDEGDAGTVTAFTEGETLAYGFGLGGEDEALADQLWQAALQSYMRNEFDEADARLAELEELGGENENLGKLKANLDVVQGRGDGADATKDVQARRVVAQAASRGLDDLRAQQDAQIEAEREYQAGNYAVAEERYREVEALANKLNKVEQAESVEQTRNVALSRQKRDEVAKAKKDKAAILDDLEQEAPDVAVFDFDDDSVEGELSMPDGDFLQGVEGSVEGGVLGGVVGGVLGGVAAPAAGDDAPEPAPESRMIVVEDLKNVPTRSFDSVVVVAGSAGPAGIGLRGRGGGAAAGRASRSAASVGAPPPEAPKPSADPAPEPDVDASGFEVLQVTSTAQSVVIPVLGETVNYQHLLLPAGAEHAVRIEARTPRSSHRSSR